MSPIQRAVAVTSVAALVWACGGKTYGDADSGMTGDDIETDGGNNGDSAAGDGATNDSATSDSACGNLGCIDANPVCPSTPPPFGSICAGEGMVCTFGPGCGPQCTCEAHVWKCIAPPCPPPVCPPSPPSGSCNGEVGLSCSWGSGCNMEMCDCVATSGGPVWECSGTGCIDAGH